MFIGATDESARVIESRAWKKVNNGCFMPVEFMNRKKYNVKPNVCVSIPPEQNGISRIPKTKSGLGLRRSSRLNVHWRRNEIGRTGYKESSRYR